MGADIYLKSAYDKNVAEWQPKFDAAVQARNAASAAVKPNKQRVDELQKAVDEAYNGLYSKGYYRDSYNESNLLWLYDVSYWRDFQKGRQFPLTSKGQLPIKAARELRELLLSKPDLTETVKERLAAGKLHFSEPIEEVAKFFNNKRDRFVALLDESIRLNEKLDCSF